MNSNENDDRCELPELDADWVVRDLGDDEEAYRAVAGMFLEDLPAMHHSLDRINDQSAVALVPAIHEVANSLGVIGARRGAALVRDAERRVRQGEAMSPQDLRGLSHRALDRAEVALCEWLGQADLGVKHPLG
jgi:HPt (histidine-containing phosphotransfer) domain-containing protein